jgi:hypothetical protein
VLRYYRPLIWFWSGLLAISAGVAATVQVLGPLPLPASPKTDRELRPYLQRTEPGARFNSQPETGNPAQATTNLLSAVVAPTTFDLAPPKKLGVGPPSFSRPRPISTRPGQAKVGAYAPAIDGTFSEGDFKNRYMEPKIPREGATAYIGTYTTGPDGVRVFVPNPNSGAK